MAIELEYENCLWRFEVSYPKTIEEARKNHFDEVAYWESKGDKKMAEIVSAEHFRAARSDISNHLIYMVSNYPYIEKDTYGDRLVKNMPMIDWCTDDEFPVVQTELGEAIYKINAKKYGTLIKDDLDVGDDLGYKE